LVQVIVTAPGEGANADPEFVTASVAVTVRAAPEDGVKVSVTVWPFVAPLQPAPRVKLKLVAVLIELTDRVAGLGSVTTPVGDAVAVTFTALPVTAWVIPTIPAVGPSSVSQLRVKELGFATRVALVVTASVAVTVRAVPVAGVNVSVTCWPLVAPAQPEAIVKL
jgi:hypothetical protein